MKLTYMEPDRILSEIRQRLTIPLVNILANRHCLRHILFPFSNPLQSVNATIKCTLLVLDFLLPFFYCHFYNYLNPICVFDFVICCVQK